MNQGFKPDLISQNSIKYSLVKVEWNAFNPPSTHISECRIFSKSNCSFLCLPLVGEPDLVVVGGWWGFSRPLCATICAINSYVQCAIVQRKAKSSRPLPCIFLFIWFVAGPAYQMIAPAAAEKVQEICEWYLRRRNSPKLHQIEIVAPPILKWHTIEKISLSSFSEMAFNWNVNTTPTSWNGIELKWYIEETDPGQIWHFSISKSGTSILQKLMR